METFTEKLRAKAIGQYHMKCAYRSSSPESFVRMMAELIVYNEQAVHTQPLHQIFRRQRGGERAMERAIRRIQRKINEKKKHQQ